MMLEEICRDLAAEHDALDALVAPLGEAGWDTPTPAEGWAIRDQISHLAFFDEVAAVAATDPDRFAGMFDGEDAAGVIERAVERGRSARGTELLSWWREARAGLLGAMARTDPAARVPWFGPAMSPASFVTARLMETWAHGQDVADALGADRAVTDRIRHVCHIGVLALPWSFGVRGLTPPDGQLRVELEAPSGERWTWGPAEATSVVRGPAIDFALLSTQRRHRADTALEAHGELADAFLDVAQAFAGPPGAGRQPLGAG